jgi:hypothetical protein
VGDRTRTGDILIHSHKVAERKVLPGNSSGDNPSQLAVPLARQGPPDPDLAHVIEGWAGLPSHIKAAVLALVGTAR